MIGSQALAFGLGDPAVSSALGQPLQMTVPLVGDPDVELSQECVRLIPGAEGGDQIPALSAARVLLEPGANQLRVESAQTIQEPVLRIVVEVGCAQRVRREFTLLMDPPSLSAPVADAAVDRPSTEPSIGLGMAQISAVLGQPLSMKVPVTGTSAASLTADCVQLADPISSEGAPVLRQARISVGPQDGGSLIQVISTEPVTEPAVRVTLDVGCVEPLRREYAILLGLPPLAASGDLDSRSPSAIAQAPEPRTRSKAARAAQAVPKLAPTQTAAPAPKSVAAAPATGPSSLAVVAQAPIAEKAPVRPADRLVLSSTADAAANADALASQAAQNAALLKRMDDMSRQLQTLSSDLAASRARVRDLERNASDSREVWTWLLGALGGLLLGGALALAWRHRHSVAPAWESVPKAASPQDSEAAMRVRTQRSGRVVPEIGGRATMASAPTTVNAATDPTLPDDRHTEITVTELHDTVQVIKELYATVLERNSTTGSGGESRPPRPLELDLNAPTVGNAIGPGARARPASMTPAVLAQNGARDPADTAPQTKVPAETNMAARTPRVMGGDTQVPRRRGSDHGDQDERFTELPTEMGIDLDLGTVLKNAPLDETAPLDEPSAIEPRPFEPHPFEPRPFEPRLFTSRELKSVAPAADASSERVPFRASLSWREPTAPAPPPVRPAAGEIPTVAASVPFPEENLTQSPTELSIDLDVGEPSRLSGGAPPVAPVLPLSRITAARSKGNPPALAPIDLQLDLNQGESRSGPREDRTA